MSKQLRNLNEDSGGVLKGTKVRVYRNLTRKCYSVQEKVGKSWLVAAYRTQPFFLTNVAFNVSEAGCQRVLNTKRKNVHAFVVGTYMGISHTAIEDLTFAYQEVKPISYNPYKGGFFFDKVNGQPVKSADVCWVTNKGVWAAGITYGETTGGTN